MKKISVKRGVVAIFVLLATLFSSAPALAVEPLDLKTSIEAKTKELDEINKKLAETQENLNETQVLGKTLKQEISSIDGSISRVNLSIKSSEITIQKLRLEIESLQEDISAKEQDIDVKRETVIQLLQSFQEKDGENTLMIFLKNKSLADSMTETETITNLNSGLLEEVDRIRQLKSDLSDRLSLISDKKVGIETENQSLKVRKSVIEDQKADRQQILAQTKNQEKAYQQVISELEKRQQEISDEMAKIEEQLRTSFDPTLLPIKRSGVLNYPVASPRLSQEYGATRFAQRAYKTKFHNGVDFAASIGTAVYAAEEGTVFSAGNNGKIQYGRYIVIKHPNNLATLYAHLSRQVVANGDTVTKGQLIGYSGNTGYSTGPHLHFTVFWGPSVTLKTFAGAGMVPVGVTINPDDYL